MGLKSLMDFILEQGKYAIIMFVVFLVSRNIMRSRIAQIATSLGTGALAYFFLNDPEKVFNAIGTLIEKIIGG